MFYTLPSTTDTEALLQEQNIIITFHERQIRKALEMIKLLKEGGASQPAPEPDPPKSVKGSSRTA